MFAIYFMLLFSKKRLLWILGFLLHRTKVIYTTGHGTEHCTTCHHPKPDDVKCYLSVNHCTHSWRNHPILCKHFINIDFLLDAIATISRWSFRKRTHQISYIIARTNHVPTFSTKQIIKIMKTWRNQEKKIKMKKEPMRIKRKSCLCETSKSSLWIKHII